MPMTVDLDGLPERIERRSAWTARDLAADPSVWLYHLTPADISELEAAAHRFLETGNDIGGITKSAFALGGFADHLAALKTKLLDGIGFEVIRGLPVDEYTQKFAAAIFCGIGAHLGSTRSQNASGHVLGHVRDVGADAEDENTRIYQTSERQTFHTDSADVVGLLCLRTAKTGGDSLLVSIETIYNRIRAERPDLLPYLFDEVATDRRGEVPQDAEPYFTIPVLSWLDGFLTVMYQRQYIESAQRFDSAPKLNENHVAALDYLDALANDPELHFAMALEPGDMQFVYNHSQLHDRTGFDDWPEPDRKRHLLRLWLSIEGDRPLPECFKQRYGSIEIGNRGGIITEHTRLHAPIDS